MRKLIPTAAPSGPITTERRDTRSCVTVERAESGPMGARMRFVPVLPEFIIQMEVPRPGIFSAFVAFLQTGIQLSGTPEGHAPAVFRTERAGCKATFCSHVPRTQE